MVANILGEVEFTTVLAWLMARENPRLRYARYCEVFAHETGGKDRWPVYEALIAVLLRLSQG